jgi:CRISPR/Cas system-associated endoribonuclease Cas2
LYRVAFVVDETFSAISAEEISNVFQLVIDKASDELEPYDIKVSKTVENIVERFFHNVQNSMIYICSDENDKAKIRFKVFDRWYKKSEYKVFIVKIDNIIQYKISETETQKMYTSFMFHRDNPIREKLTEIYNQIEKVLNEEK